MATVIVYHNNGDVISFAKEEKFGIPNTVAVSAEIPVGKTFEDLDPRVYALIDGVLEIDASMELNTQVLDEASRLDSLQTKIDKYLTAIHNRVAKENGYDSILHVRSWTSYPNPYHKACVEIAEWAGGTYSAIEIITSKVLTGDYEVNEMADVEKFVPPFVKTVGVQ